MSICNVGSTFPLFRIFRLAPTRGSRKAFMSFTNPQVFRGRSSCQTLAACPVGSLQSHYNDSPGPRIDDYLPMPGTAGSNSYTALLAIVRASVLSASALVKAANSTMKIFEGAKALATTGITVS